MWVNIFCWTAPLNHVTGHYFTCSEICLNSSMSPLTGAQVTQLTDRTRNLTNFLWSRKRAPDNFTLRKKAATLEKELWEKAMEQRQGGWHMNPAVALAPWWLYMLQLLAEGKRTSFCRYGSTAAGGSDQEGSTFRAQENHAPLDFLEVTLSFI